MYPASPPRPEHPSPPMKPNFHHNYARPNHDFRSMSFETNPTNSRNLHPSLTTKEKIARKLQRIDILLNLIHARVANDRALTALLPYISELESNDLVSNFAYVRHQQDTQELKPTMTDKQTYRIFRHHFGAEQRLADTIRQLRRSIPPQLSRNLPEAPPTSTSHKITPFLSHAVTDLEDQSASMVARSLQQTEQDLEQIYSACHEEDELLYIREFSQAQQINTMKARCVAMKDEYEAECLRKGRPSWTTTEVKRLATETISGPEEWEEDTSDPPVSLSNASKFTPLDGEWTPPDPPLAPRPVDRLPQIRERKEEKLYQDDSDVLEPGRAPSNYSFSRGSEKEYQHRRSRQRSSQPDLHRKAGRAETREHRNQEYRERRDRASRVSYRRSGRGDTASRTFESHSWHRLRHEDPSRQRLPTRARPPLQDTNYGPPQRRYSHDSQYHSRRPGHTQRSSRHRGTRRRNSSSYAPDYLYAGQYRYDQDIEFPTAPDLSRQMDEYRESGFHNHSFASPPTGTNMNNYTGEHGSVPFRGSYTHEPAEPFHWESPVGAANQYYMEAGTANHPGTSYPVPGYQNVPPSPPAPAFPQNVNRGSFPGPTQVPLYNKDDERHEWRYTNGYDPGFKDPGILHSIANRVKGKRSRTTISENPLAVMQMARKDPVKFVTQMVAGDVLPQSARKANKFEEMLYDRTAAQGMAGQLGGMVTKLTTDSIGQGLLPTKKKVVGEVGKTLVKAGLNSAVGRKSSKANVTSQITNAITKVAVDSAKKKLTGR